MFLILFIYWFSVQGCYKIGKLFGYLPKELSKSDNMLSLRAVLRAKPQKTPSFLSSAG